jgi:hypothetical protein
MEEGEGGVVGAEVSFWEVVGDGVVGFSGGGVEDTCCVGGGVCGGGIVVVVVGEKGVVAGVCGAGVTGEVGSCGGMAAEGGVLGSAGMVKEGGTGTKGRGVVDGGAKTKGVGPGSAVVSDGGGRGEGGGESSRAIIVAGGGGGREEEELAREEDAECGVVPALGGVGVDGVFIFWRFAAGSTSASTIVPSGFTVTLSAFVEVTIFLKCSSYIKSLYGAPISHTGQCQSCC